MESEWFRIVKDNEALNPKLSALRSQPSALKFQIDNSTFEKIDDSVSYYKNLIYNLKNDFIFEPTFLISDRLQQLFSFLEPDIQFKGVQLYATNDQEGSSKPLYWLPYLQTVNAIHESTKTIQGKPIKIILRREFLKNRRVIHCTLPAADIWLLSLEAAECLLRRSPIGVSLEKVSEIF